MPSDRPLQIPRNSSKINILISLVFHGIIIAALFYFAAREGMLGKQLRRIAVEMVKEKPPEKPKEPEKPKPEPPRIEPPKIAAAPKPVMPEPAAPPLAVRTLQATAPPPVAPPPAEVPAFVFDGGKLVESSSDPIKIYKGLVESTLRSKWNRPEDVADDNFAVEVEVSVNPSGQIVGSTWKKQSGDSRWDESVRQALAHSATIPRPPPPNFPAQVLVRFDVQDETQPLDQ